MFCDDVQPAAGEPGEAHTTQQNDLGTLRHFSDGNLYIYLRGVAGLVANDAVIFHVAYNAIRSTLTTLGPFAIATANPNAQQFGWFFFSGIKTVNAASVAAAETPAYASAVPGQLDDTVQAGARIMGAIFRSTGTGTATLQVIHGGGAIASDL